MVIVFLSDFKISIDVACTTFKLLPLDSSVILRQCVERCALHQDDAVLVTPPIGSCTGTLRVATDDIHMPHELTDCNGHLLQGDNHF